MRAEDSILAEEKAQLLDSLETWPFITVSMVHLSYGSVENGMEGIALEERRTRSITGVGLLLAAAAVSALVMVGSWQLPHDVSLDQSAVNAVHAVSGGSLGGSALAVAGEGGTDPAGGDHGGTLPFGWSRRYSGNRVFYLDQLTGKIFVWA